MLLKLRADDSLELRKWLNRPEKQKWLSPEIENEILQDLLMQRFVSYAKV